MIDDALTTNSKSNEPVYMISVAAKLCEVHVQTLRLYERLGLIQPARIKGKNRLYSEADVERVKQIQTLTQVMGVNLAGVEVIFRLKEQMAEMRAQMEQEVDRMQREAFREFERISRQFNLPVVYNAPLPARLPDPEARINETLDDLKSAHERPKTR